MYSVMDTALRGGLPHSDIPGSQVALTSPELFAECHVFLRLSLPRHPPDALSFLILNYAYVKFYIPLMSFCFP